MQKIYFVVRFDKVSLHRAGIGTDATKLGNLSFSAEDLLTPLQGQSD
jgi:hypothetical protein